MRDFKRAIISTVSVLLAVIAISVAVLWSPFAWHDDLKLRQELAGTLDFLVLGASHARQSLYTEVLDEEIGCNSYNLSFDSMRTYEKSYFLNKELSRNDIKTVVLEISHDTMEKTRVSEYTDTNAYAFARMENAKDRWEYFKLISTTNKAFLYPQLMLRNAVSTVKGLLGKDAIDSSMRKMKGSKLAATGDYRLPENEIVEKYNSKTFTTETFQDHAISGLDEMVDVCLERNIRVIAAVVPVSDSYIWEYKDLDSFEIWLKEHFKDKEVEVYDFNLLKDRYTLFSDEYSYYGDNHHMSGEGAKVFSEKFAEILNEAEKGKDVSQCFFATYEELKEKSPYMEYYKSHK